MEKVFAIQGKKEKAKDILRVLELFGCKKNIFYYGFLKCDIEDDEYCFSVKGALPISELKNKDWDVFDIDFFMEKFGKIVERIPYKCGHVGIEGSLVNATVIGLRYIDGKIKPLADVHRLEYCDIEGGDLADYNKSFL